MLNVKELRSKYGLSQEQLSELTSIPRGRINSWERRGGSPIKMADIKALQTVFDKFENKNSNADKNVPRENGAELKISYEKRLEEKERIILANETTIFIQTERIKELKEAITELKERIRLLEQSPGAQVSIVPSK